LFFLCSIFPDENHNHRTCLINSYEHRARPNLDTFVPSPSNHFYIHYDEDGYNAPDSSDEYGMLNQYPNTIPDYVDEVALIADEIRDIMINEFNFLSEIGDTDGIYDIYIKNKGNYNYGINIPDDIINGASYIEIDNGYEEGAYYTSGINTMRLTLAHEFFHAIQRAYNSPAFGHTFLWEMAATFIEDIIVPDGNDYIFWVDSFFQNPNMNISSSDGYSIALFGHYLKDEIANGNINIMREIWENYSISNDPFASIENILENNYGKNFQFAWSDFISRLFFNGVYQDMNNDIYFYIDQKDMTSLSSSLSTPTLISESTSFIDLFINNESSKHHLFIVDDSFSINVENITSNGVEGFISVLSNQNINFNQHKYMNNIPSVVYLEQGDVLFLTHALNETGYLDFNINLSSSVQYIGDCNLDQEINVIDIVILIDYILLELFPNQIQFVNSDLNNDDMLNIFDIVLLIEIILN